MECCENGQKKKTEGGKSAETSAAGVFSLPPASGKSHITVVVLGLLIFGLLVYNQLLINNLNAQLVALGTVSTATNAAGIAVVSSASSGTATGSGSGSLSTQRVWDSIRPQGVPEVYGSELQVRYDNVEGAIARLAPMDDLGNTPIRLEGEPLQRYITITTAISCEYCCGAPAIATATGAPACGCAHSAAMRGLAKYLLQNHSNMSDQDILGELGKWKVLFFPQDSVKKALILEANGLPTDYISLSSNQYRGLKMPTGGGGNSGGSGNALPSQVGGC